MLKLELLQPEVSDASEVLHLKLWEGTAFDYSLNGNGGTLTGTTLTYRHPGLDLEGSDEHIVVDDDAAFTPALTPLSISAWVYMHDATDFYIVSKGKYNTDGEWRFGTKADDKFHCRIFDEDVNNCYLGREYSVALAENIWLHLVMTYGGGTTSANCKLYQNGVQVDNANHQASAASFVTVRASGHAVWLGRNPDNFFANGLIDDVRIYNTERTAVQIKDFYEQTRWRYSI